jgi:lipopolysaccharide transport system ATP-binding protein
VGDAEFQKKAIGKMQNISREGGRTVLFVSHNMAAVKQLCTRGIVLENGKVAFEGGVEEALSRYYMSNYIDSENNSCGTYDFNKHIDKKDKYGIINAELYCNGQLSGVVYTGSQLMIKLDFVSNREFFEGEIGIVIKDLDQISYIGINNKHIGNSIIVKEGKGSAVISIDDFPLFANGDYWINLYFGDDGPDYECLENAIKFKIIGEDVFGSGRILDKTWNKVYHSKISIKTI